ncbi:MAG: CPBP family intramembrane metalloprotease, partial [Candidatus Lokiarchaeota archaeon]|nr:CPBP family intramembrane metalloprotease [Candidatus Lokiarchaeota archaeon]
DFPLNLFYGIFGIIVWGPLEVFFFIYLVVNTEQILKQDDWKISKGLIITTILFGLSHVLTTNWWNAIYTGILFFIIGLIYKFSNNIIGPIITWTLINGQVWFIAQMLFQ